MLIDDIRAMIEQHPWYRADKADMLRLTCVFELSIESRYQLLEEPESWVIKLRKK